MRSKRAMLAGLLASTAVAAIVGTLLWKPAKPNILFVTLDTVRADHCSVYGYKRRTTPNLEKLGARAVVFDNAYAPMATSAPSHASMFTGLYPIDHGVVKNAYVLSNQFRTLAEHLSEKKYETAAVVSSFVLNAKFGLNQGFAAYDDAFTEEAGSTRWPWWEGLEIQGVFDQRAAPATRKAISWLETLAQRKKPFLLWVHYFDPHAPYDPPPPYDHFVNEPLENPTPLDLETARYDGEIEYMDAELGRLLDSLERLGLSSNTIVVIAGDHGEGLMQHGHMEHGLQLYEEAVRVPLLIAWEPKLKPRRVSESVALVDLMPTLLELLDEPPMKSPAGASLAGCLRSGTSCGNRPVFLQRRHYDEGALSPDGRPIQGYQFGVRDGRWKYLEAEEENHRELYDLEADPGEQVNLATRAPDELKRSSGLIRSILRARFSGKATHQSISDEDRQKLKALGYLQ